MASVVDYMLIKRATLQGIGNAIREKKGTNNLIPVPNMEAEIRSIQGTSLVRGECTIPVGGKFSFNCGGMENVSVYLPSCVTYTIDGDSIIFTAVSAGSGTITVMSESTTLISYTVTITGSNAENPDSGSGGTTTCNHSQYTMVVTQVATCSKSGVKTYTCSTCSHTWTEDIPKSKHNWSAPYYSTTDFTSGYGMKCTVCGKKTEGACPHTNTDSTITEPATCTSTGVRTITCTNCGEILGTETIPKTSHYLLNDWTEIDAPTCTQEGKERRWCHNDNCGYYEDRSISTVDHKWGDPIEWGDGYAKECSVCGKTEILPDENCKHGNAEFRKRVNPTCTSGGYDVFYCSDCGYEWEDNHTEALGHNYVPTVKAPTCTSKGYTTHTCSRCFVSYDDSYTDALGHSAGDPVLVRAATCTVAPEYAIYCTRCKVELDRYEDDGGLAEHIADGGKVTKAATCEVEGTYTYYCRECGTWVKSEPITALGHSWDSPYYSSEFSSGYGRKCNRCGELEELDYVECEHPASAYSETVIISPTCTTKGSKTCSCDVCRTSWSEEIAKLDHDWEYYPDPSVSSGTSRVCRVCELVEEDVPL